MFDRTGRLIAERTRLVDDLVAMMSIEELLGQLVIYDLSKENSENSLSDSLVAALERGEVGTLWLDRKVAGDPRPIIAAASDVAVGRSRLGLPLLTACSLECGHRTAFPSSLAAAASWDPETIARMDRIAAIEATADGANWAFGPSIAARGARELAAEEPTLAARIVAARIRGIQGDRLIRPDTMLASLECRMARNAAHGEDTAAIDDFLPAYLAAARDGRVASVTFEKREGGPEFPIDPLGVNWDFGAIVLSKWSEIVRRALGDAFDVERSHTFPVAAVAEAARDGRVPLIEIEDAARRVLGAKFDLGLFRDPSLYLRRERSGSADLPDIHREVALDIARKSVVLLKNNDAILPLDTNVDRSILLLGPLAEDKHFALGGNVRSVAATSLHEGLLRQGCFVRQLRGLGQGAADEEDREGSLSRADRMAIGLACDAAGRASRIVIAIAADADDPASLRREKQLVLAVAKTNPKVVLVVLNDGRADLGWAAPFVASIVFAGRLGVASGEALAEILCGTFNPSGKLPVALTTFDLRDEREKVLFPLGHGLAYTAFTYSDVSLELAQDRVIASFALRNTGAVAGTETAQLYLRPCNPDGEACPLRLKCFARVALEPGEMRKMTFDLAAGEFGRYRADGRLALDPGRYEIAIGTSSQRTISREIELPADLAQAMLRFAGSRSSERGPLAPEKPESVSRLTG